jgi:hypothetical protein
MNKQLSFCALGGLVLGVTVAVGAPTVLPLDMSIAVESTGTWISGSLLSLGATITNDTGNACR